MAEEEVAGAEGNEVAIDSSIPFSAGLTAAVFNFDITSDCYHTIWKKNLTSTIKVDSDSEDLTIGYELRFVDGNNEPIEFGEMRNHKAELRRRMCSFRKGRSDVSSTNSVAWNNSLPSQFWYPTKAVQAVIPR